MHCILPKRSEGYRGHTELMNIYIYIHTSYIYILKYWILLTRNVVQDVQGDVAAPSLL